MARPRKKLDELRVHQVSVRLTASENDFVRKQADLAGLSIVNYMRVSALAQKEIRAKVTPLQLSHYKALRGIGVNINQLARKLNMGENLTIAKEFQELRELLSKIYFLFQK